MNKQEFIDMINNKVDYISSTYNDVLSVVDDISDDLECSIKADLKVDTIFITIDELRLNTNFSVDQFRTRLEQIGNVEDTVLAFLSSMVK